MSNAIHPWETAGLGLAPYRYLGASREVFQACQGAPIQPAGSCDFCGQAIWFQVRFESADGKRFKVGCDCAKRAGEGGKRLADWERAQNREKARAAKARKVDAAVAAHGELLAEVEAIAALGNACPSHFLWSMARGIANTIRAGKAPSARQIAALARAKEESTAA